MHPVKNLPEIIRMTSQPDVSLSQKPSHYRKASGLFPEKGSEGFHAIPPGSVKESRQSAPAPLECILGSIQEAIDQQGLQGVQVRLQIPLGVEIAKKTLNSRVGIEGGISVLGTTGLVEPWDDHLEESICERVSLSRNAVLTTGRIGLRYARLFYPNHDIVLVGGKIGEALEAARGEVILFGLPALILRYINPHILDGTGFATVEEFAASDGFHHALQTNLTEFRKKYPQVRIVLINRNGVIIGENP